MTDPSVPEVGPSDVPNVASRWRLALALLRRMPQGLLSRGFGRLADARLPPALRRPLIGGFARLVGADLGEARGAPGDYASLNAFFVRRLRPGLRAWPSDPLDAGSPVDGIVGAFGAVRSGRVVQAKGLRYGIADLLGDETEADGFSGGTFLTLYLSPRHYHRIHAPVGGSIALARHVPGALLPVNEAAVATIPNLFPRNERLLCHIDSPVGRVAVVAVGAYNVGRISAAFDDGWGAQAGRPGWVTNRPRAVVEARRYEPPVPVARGDDLMAFHLGSTVVLLFPEGVALDEGLQPGAEIRLGQRIAGAVETQSGGAVEA